MSINFDLRQEEVWGDYLEKIGWIIEYHQGVQLAIKRLPFVGFSVIKIQHPTKKLDFKTIDKVAKKYKTALVVIEPLDTKTSEDKFRKNGYKQTLFAYMHTATVIIKLSQSRQNLFRSFSENARRNIRKAEKNNLIVKHRFPTQKNIPTVFDEFYKLFKNLSSLKGFYLPPRQELLNKMKTLRKNTFVSFAYENPNTEPIAAIWFCYFKDTLYYLNTGVRERGYELLANYQLVWEGLQHGQEMGLKIFDFGGIYDPRFPKLRKSARHYSQFKKRFHGMIVEYPTPWIKLYSWPFKLLYLCSSNLLT